MEKLISVVELPEFRNFAKSYLDEEECMEIINHIAANPTEGDLIQGSGGIRKIRFAARNKGKSGGIRVIYYYHNENMPVFLITAFLKNQMENISKATCNEFKKLTEQLKKLYNE
jgi:putative transcriptional regulator